MKLDEDQVAVLSHRSGRAQVRAVPGAGKTTLLVAYVGSLLDDGFDPRRIVVTTHTRSAAKEFSERLIARWGRVAKDVPVATIHAHALRWVRQHRRVEVLDELGQQHLWAQVLGRPTPERPWAIGPTEKTVAEIFVERSNGQLTPESRRALDAYATAKIANGVMDFDDVLLAAMDYSWEVDIDALIVDEAQDCSEMQFALLDSIPARCALAVGDVAQAVYGFAGARPDLLAKFGGRPFVLRRSWRLPRAVASWGWHGLTDIHQEARGAGEDAHHGDHGAEQAP